MYSCNLAYLEITSEEHTTPIFSTEMEYVTFKKVPHSVTTYPTNIVVFTTV